MNRRTQLLCIAAFLGAVLIAAVVLFFFYPEVLRIHILVPVIEAYFISRYYLEFVPQFYLWLIPPLIVTLIMCRRFVRWAKRGRTYNTRQPSPISPGEGELAQLAQQIRRAHYSRFARVRLSRTLIEIGARLVAGKDGLSVQQARRRLAEGYWRSDPSLHMFLTPRKHYTARQSGTAFEQSLRETITHLEEFGDDV